MITYRCPRCRHAYTASDAKAGQKINCVACGQRVQIPLPPPGAHARRGRLEGAAPPQRGAALTKAILAASGLLTVAGIALIVIALATTGDDPAARSNGPVAASPSGPLDPTPAKGPAAVKDDLPKQALHVLKTHCHRCHGENGTAEGGINYVLDLEKLVARNRVVPGNPAKSRLFRRVSRGEMPPEEEKTRPGADEIALLKRWIEAGAAPVSNNAPPPSFITTAAMMQYIRTSLLGLPARERRFARFFTLTHLANAGLHADELQTYRVALSKLLNSLSWNKEIVLPRPVDPGKTIYRIDIRDYQWSGKLWKRILSHYPHGILWADPAAKESYDLVGEDLPFVRADWFVAAASRPPLYHELLQLPETEQELEKQLHIDVAENVRQERVARAGFNGSGVSRNNRLIERHPSPYGSYWRSYDFASNKGQQNLFAFPLGPTAEGKGLVPDGGEIIFSLPNGLNAFMLVNAQGGRLDKAPLGIVSDPRRPDRAVENGISCMTCHARGFIPAKDQIRLHVEKNPTSFSEREREAVTALYPPADKLAALFGADNDRFRSAVQQCGGKITKTEAITGLVAVYEREVDLRTAASEAGLRPAELSERLAQSPSLLRDLGPLRIPGGTVQREVFTDRLPALVQELKLGTVVAPTP